MVSEKIIVVLIIVAILISIISIAVTVLTLDTEMIPKIQQKSIVIGELAPDYERAQVSIGIIQPPGVKK